VFRKQISQFLDETPLDKSWLLSSPTTFSFGDISMNNDEGGRSLALFGGELTTSLASRFDWDDEDVDG